MKLLESDFARNCLVEAIIRARGKHPFRVWAYVFMPEHVHLLLWPTGPKYSISAILKSIKQSVARRVILDLQKENPDDLRTLATGRDDCPFRFWQEGPGYDRNIYEFTTLRNSIDYIHANPVRRRLVKRPLEWLWSSARFGGDGSNDVPVSVDAESFPVR